MARFQCLTCNAVETVTASEPQSCARCGGPVFDLDRYMTTRAEAAIIGAQNDAFRKALAPVEWQGQTLRGRVVVTRGIRDMGPEVESDPSQTIRVLTLCLPDEY
ncbi:hypothetical protein [Paenirhodobacter populi]|uniref:Uncharacterized protein n=1 Tax=Paenirhodobacter populi TaxID=2306993 RepID=A0A443IRP2_9RHOB|nr:hypothetical protein [Sinirhodobacter populi]RWR09171.1 hypothetical protein D2T33_14315 [Sinirhodobacter populi]